MSFMDQVTAFFGGTVANTMPPPAPQRRFSEDLGSMSVSDPAFAEWLEVNNYALPSITADKAMTLTAAWRASRVIIDTVAALSFKTYQENGTTASTRVTSWLDEPAGPYANGGIGPFTWKQWILASMVNRGGAYIQHVYNGAGQIIGGLPVPVGLVKPEWVVEGDRVFKRFTVKRKNKKEIFESDSKTAGMDQILAFTEDGITPISVVELFRRTLETTAAGEESAARSFTGAPLEGLISADEDIPETEADAIADKFDQKLANKAGSKFLFVNRKFKFTPWSMTADDAQFLTSRAFQIDEIARMYGVPVNLLMVSGAVSNWGTGAAENKLGLMQFTLNPFTKPFEETFTRHLPPGQYVEFDFKSFLRPTPEQQVKLVIEQYKAQIITLNEARGLIGLTPIEGGDTMTIQPAAPEPPGAGEEDAAS